MKNLTFQQQVWLGGIIFVLTIILSHVLHIGFIHNLGWIIYGLLFIINPLPPENAHGEPQKLRNLPELPVSLQWQSDCWCDTIFSV